MLPDSASSLRRPPWLWLAWGLLLLVALGLGVRLMLQAGEDLLRRDAERAALQYAAYLAETTPGLPALMQTRQLQADTLEQLRRGRRLGDVFRFKLFDAGGRLLLVSDALGEPRQLPADGEILSAHHGGKMPLLGALLAGQPVLMLKEGQGRPDRPARYVEAYVPLREGERQIGIIEVYVDTSALHAAMRSSFHAVLAVASAWVLLFGLTLLMQARRRQADRRRSGSHLRYLARHDTLSGALNRASFRELLQKACGATEPFALLCIDLDHFKTINDEHGHAAGDAVLKTATQRLQSLVRQSDAVARLGGDEFVLLLRDVRDASELRPLGERIVESLAEPVLHEGRQLRCGASVGAALAEVEGRDPELLMQRADVALYRAKADGRGRFCLYDPAFDRELAAQRALLAELREAVAQDQLLLHYQPIFDAQSLDLLGYEALLRWPHPRRGMVSPSQFVPLAEQAGLISAIGAQALRRACREAASWPAPLTVAVNLSAAQFDARQSLVDEVRAALADSGLAPQRLVLEVTESVLLQRSDSVLAGIQQLQALGVHLALDDFGTGYSSLAYLWRFPFWKLKIDRSFTHGLGHDARVPLLVRAMVALAHSMRMRVTAEGVETEAQCLALQRLGCDELQGFLLGLPMAPQELSHAGAVTEQPQLAPGPDFDDIETQRVPL